MSAHGDWVGEVASSHALGLALPHRIGDSTPPAAILGSLTIIDVQASDDIDLGRVAGKWRSDFPCSCEKRIPGTYSGQTRHVSSSNRWRKLTLRTLNMRHGTQRVDHFG